MGMILMYIVAIVMVVAACRSIDWYEHHPKPKQKRK